MTTPSPLPESTTPRVRSLHTLGRLVRRFASHRAAAVGVFCLLLLRTAFEMSFPLLVAAAIDGLQASAGKGGALPDGFVTLLVGLGAVMLLRNVFLYASQVSATRLGQTLENELRSDLFGRVLALRFAYHDENRSGETIARSLRDMEKARHFFREVWFGYLEITILVAVVVALVFLEHWTYGLVVSLTFGVGIAACVLVGRRIAALDRDVCDTYDDVATTLQENVAGARVVRAFGRETHEVARFGGHMDRYTRKWAAMERFWTGVMPGVNHVYHLCLPAILVLGTLRVAGGGGGVGEVTAVLLYVRTVHHRIRPLTRLVILGQQALASASRVFEVLDRQDLIPEPARPRTLPPAAGGGDLVLEDVRFGHAGGTPVLRGVTLHVPAGGSLGLLGPTGSGKSSLVQLLPRFYDPDAGSIRLDGIDLRDLSVHDLRATVGLVFQEPFLFSGTVAENIAYGNPSASRETVERCARLAAAHEFIEDLPQGYGTVVGERGVSLSGGQRQRLTIARALAMDPRVLIFDDATASVDAVTERTLFEGIRAAARGRTTLVISQRVTSVRWCDRIAVLEEGVITGLGTHEELLRRSSLYAEILRHQELTRVAS